LRPRRLRDAATLWNALHQELGMEGRDRLWNHPDLLPSADDLDDVPAFIRAQSTGTATQWSVEALDEAGPAPTDPERGDPPGEDDGSNDDESNDDSGPPIGSR